MTDTQATETAESDNISDASVTAGANAMAETFDVAPVADAALETPAPQVAADPVSLDPPKDWARENILWLIREIDLFKNGLTDEKRRELNP